MHHKIMIAKDKDEGERPGGLWSYVQCSNAMKKKSPKTAECEKHSAIGIQ